MKRFAKSAMSLATYVILGGIILVAPAIATVTNENFASAKLLKSSDQERTISLSEAFALALKNYASLQLAQTQLERMRVENAMRIGALLPKLRLGSTYTRNIPDVESKALASIPDTQILNRHVATLLRKSGDTKGADDLEHQADLMSRRRPESILVLNPKHVVDAKLTLEIPLFNGGDIARLLQSGEKVEVQQARVRDEQAKTIFTTAKAYFLALYRRNILLLREQAEVVAEERYQKAEVEHRRGVIMEKDFLYAHANILQRQAERQSALLEYRSSIGELGLVLGLDEEFRIDAPDQMIFEPLNGDAEHLVAVAVDNRADLRAEREELRVVENERFGQFLQFLPNLSLQGDAKYTSNEKTLIGKNFTYAISLNANVSLFDGGMGIAHMRDTALKRQESEIRLRKLRREIDASIRGRREKLAQLALHERAAQVMAEAATEAEHVALSRHKRGVIDLQEYLVATDKKLSADIAYKKAQSDVTEEKLALIYEAGLLTPQFVQ